MEKKKSISCDICGDQNMKEKLTITIESELLAVIERNMVKANYSNKSKFVEYALNQLFFSPERRLKLFESLRDRKVRELGEMVRTVNYLQEKVDLINKQKEATEQTIIKENDKDALWAGKDTSTD